LDKPMPDFMFRGMSFLFKCRDMLRPRERILEEVDIEPGYQVLDFGCGPGSYTKVVAKLVGEDGRVYAQDIHPLAGKRLRQLASSMGLGNVETICSGGPTGLPDGTVDVVLLYDIFHMLSEPDAVLAELHRVMKPNGVLSFSDHHMKEGDIVRGVTATGLFELSRQGKHTFSFTKRSDPAPV